MRDVFVTGATGTIGSALVPRLLADPDTQVCMLIRARDDVELRARVLGMLEWWGFARDCVEAARLTALRGDISLPGFGLDPSQFDRLAGQTTHVIHCAASVKLNMSEEQAHATAVAPTRTVLELGRRAERSGQLRKIDLVSTVGVWGRTPGLMPERALTDVREFHNTYESAKSEAERVVWNEGSGLPITVHRPSMVVGETTTGRVIHFQVFYHLCEFLSGARTFGVMPELGNTCLDTVPVDWVADAICWSADQPQTAGRIFHLCSGFEAAIPLVRLQETVRRLWREHGKTTPRLWHVQRQTLERIVPVISLMVGQKTRKALRALGPVLSYLALEQGFTNTDTARLLATAGLPVPRPDEYLDMVLRYYLGKPTRHSTGKI